MNGASAQNWTQLAPGTGKNLNAVFFVTADTGYVVGDSGMILKTTNGGNGWMQQDTNPPHPFHFSFKSVFFRDQNTGWLAGQYGIILRTTDGGNTWLTPLNQMPFTEVLNAVHFPTPDTGYVVGGGYLTGGYGWQDKSFNAGLHWLNPGSAGLKCLRSVYFTDAYTGYAVGDSGTIIKTVDGALSWLPQTSGTSGNLYSVYFTDVNHGYAVGDNGSILKTTNGGAVWTMIPSGTSSTLFSVHFNGMNTGYAAGDHGTILNTGDGGNTWTGLVSGTSQRLNSIFFPATNTGYVAGDSGTILKTTNGGGVGTEEDTCTPKHITIYPNPVKEKFFINVSVKQGLTLLSIFSIDGITMIEQEIIGPKTEINASDLPSGIYFIRLRNEKIVETGKIIKE